MRTSPRPAVPARARLQVPANADVELATRLAAATAMARDFVNTPASDFTPERLAAEAMQLARTHGASPLEVTGAELRQGFPAIHAVGQAPSQRAAPDRVRLGRAAAPRLTLVGKGVCFDTGGLDIKPAAGMRADEEGHGRRRHARWRWRDWSWRAAAGAAARADPGGGERDRRQRLPARAT